MIVDCCRAVTKIKISNSLYLDWPQAIFKNIYLKWPLHSVQLYSAAGWKYNDWIFLHRVRNSWARIFKLLRSPRINFKESIPPACVACVGNFSPTMGARNQVGIGLLYRSSSLSSWPTQFQTRLLELIPRPMAGLKFSTPGGTVRQHYSYSVPSPHRLFYNPALFMTLGSGNVEVGRAQLGHWPSTNQ